MNKIDQINTLFDISKKNLSEIESLYKSSLTAQQIKPELLIKIKNLLENLRSILDYIAKGIFDKYCHSDNKISVYFPILNRTSSITDYQNYMKGRFPGLRVSQPTIYAKFENYQFYKSKSNEWLMQFNDLCAENKHECLSPQIRKEETVTRLSDNTGKSISWNDGVQFGPGGKINFRPGGKLIFGPGGSVEFNQGGTSILGRQINSDTQKPTIRLGDKLERITWIDFQFSSIGISALNFLKKSFDNIINISKDFIEEIKT